MVCTRHIIRHSLNLYMSNKEIPTTLITLAYKNEYISSQFPHPDNIEGSQAAGKKYLSRVFPGWENPEKMQQHFDITENDADKFKLASFLVTEHDLGMLLIRPEMYHHSGAVLGFLTENNFRIRYVSNRNVGKEAYMAMYGDVFNRPPAIPSLPTRTIVYLDSPSMLVLFSDPKKRFSDKSLAEGFCAEYKGKEGLFNSQTIRGGVVYPEAIRLGFHTLVNEALQLALDPLTALRHIVASSTENQPHSYLPPDKSLLKYHAVSVRVPNSKEIIRDLYVLNDKDQLREIEYGISK